MRSPGSYVLGEGRILIGIIAKPVGSKPDWKDATGKAQAAILIIVSVMMD
jgi:hypothetical protein